MLIRYLFDMNISSLFFTRPSSKSFSENVNISKQESSQLNMDDTASANEPTEQILNQNNTAAQSNKIVEGMNQISVNDMGVLQLRDLSQYRAELDNFFTLVEFRYLLKKSQQFFVGLR